MPAMPRAQCIVTTSCGEESRERPASTADHRVDRGVGAEQRGLGRALRHPR